MQPASERAHTPHRSRAPAELRVGGALVQERLAGDERAVLAHELAGVALHQLPVDVEDAVTAHRRLALAHQQRFQVGVVEVVEPAVDRRCRRRRQQQQYKERH